MSVTAASAAPVLWCAPAGSCRRAAETLLSDWLDNVQVLGLLVQASGAAMIAAFSWASWRSAGHGVLRQWA